MLHRPVVGNLLCESFAHCQQNRDHSKNKLPSASSHSNSSRSLELSIRMVSVFRKQVIHFVSDTIAEVMAGDAYAL